MLPSSRKRGKAKSPISPRPKKKHKRLDAIHDKPIPSPPPPADPTEGGDGGDQNQLRRSSRSRRAPEILDSSPVPSHRHAKNKNPKPLVPISPINSNKPSVPSSSSDSKKRQFKKNEKRKSVSVSRSLSFEEEEGEEGWRSRLRMRGDGGIRKDWSPIRVSGKGKVAKRKRKRNSGGVKIDREEEDGDEEKVASFDLNELEANGEDAEARGGGGGGGVGDKVASFGEKALENSAEAGETRGGGEEGGDKSASFNEKELENSVKNVETNEENRENDDELAPSRQDAETDDQVEAIREVDEVGTKITENTNGNDVVIDNIVKEYDMASSVSADKPPGSSRVKEGRRCVLCGRGMDGKPPKKLVKESVDSDKEAYEGSSASEEPNYDIWDGFGDEPGWLGRLLGPIHDRFGIARVWVHQHCAVWSPEVYFAGLGCLKNVRATLCRGRALKCSRCGRPGATIGCRVDRCPKTYHLPCSRADGCIFDHRKFLIACNDHRRLFQPQGISYSEQIRKRKARKLKLEIRKLSNEAWRKDVEAEEKWLEHCGEDEEFLKREGKRLHRDILRIAPTYIGGSSENEKLYQGWESVAGLQGVIQCMKEVVILPLLYPDFFSNMSITPPRGVLLHGYPGTGKTLVVRALIGACSRGDKRIAYFARKGADCLGKYVGDAERQLRLLFQVAEKSQPSIIFFDEIDGLAPVRSRNQDQTHSSVVSTLLSLMDGLKSRGSVVVIGATNRPEAIDPALRRPGRFDREIYFPLPSEKDRTAILSLHTQSWPNPLSGTLLTWIANQIVGYAGADLQALCTQAAMNALKRNFALKELLSSAEKGTVHERLPSLPSLIVEERDWLAALEVAPPPCSRREAGMAANDIVSSPLPTHLIPCLLQPLLRLLINFCNDERIWLPPALSKAAKSVWRIVISSLEQRKLPTGSWWSHLCCLVEEKSIRKEIEENLCHYGLISVPSANGDSHVSDDNNGQKIDSFTLRYSCMNECKPIKMFPPKWGSLAGFRALISGSPRSGQQHLASCVLHSYMGHVDIRKVNLATISQEGHGDLLWGLTQILSRCLTLGRCVIYMPRIDLWAIDEKWGEEAEENDATTITCKSLAVSHAAKSVTEIWNSFVEQVESVSTSGSLIILATCEIKNHDLPLGIKQFFTSDVPHVDSATSEHSIPRFSVHIDGQFDPKPVLDSFSAKLSDDLVRYFIQILHQRSHSRVSSNAVEGDSEVQRKSTPNGQKAGFTDTAAYSKQSQADSSRILPSKTAVPNSTLAVVTFGYQILRYPQFAELCWITSKLREGPCTGINGPWKGWPFNACVMHRSSSPEKVSAGGNSNINKEKNNSGIVRGLTAVGLLSYRGVYASVKEVAMEVRKVLEILVGHVRAKLSARKDRYRYLRILSQAAYLEDMVNCWAYKFDSSNTNNPSADAKIGSEGRPPTENNPSIVIESCTGARETSLMGRHAETIISNGHCIDLNQGPSDDSLLNSGMSTIPGTEHSREDVPSAPLPSETVPSSSISCLYNCCSGCWHALYVLARDIVSKSWESNGRPSTVDDINDVISSCSLNLLAAFRKYDTAECGNGSAEYPQSERCACREVGEKQLKQMSSQNRASKPMFLAVNCSCHLRNDEENAAMYTECDSPFRQALSYFFRDGVLVYSEPQKDDVLHCRYDKFCLCSVVGMILDLRRPPKSVSFLN